MSDRAYRKNRSQLEERIKSGTIQTQASQDKYGFSRDEINELRAIKRLPPITGFARTRTIPDRVISESRDIKTTEGVANVLEDLKDPEGRWKDNTLMGYASRVRATARLLGIENSLDKLKDHESMIDLLEEKTSMMKNSTRKGYYGVISALAGVIPGWSSMLGEEAIKAYAKKARNESDIIDEQREEQKELGKVIPWEDIKKEGAKVTEKDPDRKMIYYLYTMIPPVRAGDYRKVAIVREDESPPKKTNHYNIDTGKMTWVDYKTQEFYGEVEIQFPKPLMKNIKTIVEARKDANQQKWLLSTSDGNPVHDKTLKKRVGEVFGVSGTELRRSYITHVLGEEFSKSRAWLNKRKALAEQMLHSPKIQEEYIRLGLKKLIGQED